MLECGYFRDITVFQMFKSPKKVENHQNIGKVASVNTVNVDSFACINPINWQFRVDLNLRFRCYCLYVAKYK